jgi:hypothetical protein
MVSSILWDQPARRAAFTLAINASNSPFAASAGNQAIIPHQPIL